MTRSPRQMLNGLRVSEFGSPHVARTSLPPANSVKQALARRTMPNLSTLSPAAVIAGGSLALRRSMPGALPAEIRVLAGRPKSVPDLAKPERFPVASVDLSRTDVGLPYGVPRMVNAATLKRIAGGRRSDRLLKKTSAGWTFVADDEMIDLSDNSVEFKLGRLTIFS